ncbi:unnamed protein product [Heterobilharzia americana]|nr:unnamed protein product [Heterobilharzia americana]
MNTEETMILSGDTQVHESYIEYQDSDLFNLVSIAEDNHYTLKCDIVSAVLASVINKLEREDTKRLGLLICTCAEKDPEFILKVAFYCHKHLGIQKTANLLISSACFYAQCCAFLSKYFDACICSPLDWIEVAEFYASLSGDSKLKRLPKALKKCMISKFPEFDQYQLAQCKRKVTTNNASKSKMNVKSSGDDLEGDISGEDSSLELTETPSIFFSLKYLVRKLHISKPVNTVMCILGKLYPSDSAEFIQMSLEGEWDASKAGLRMRLPGNSTWKKELSISSEKLSHSTILQNLESIITSNISQIQHDVILQSLSKLELVIKGRQLPITYLTAYMTIERLKEKLSINTYLQRVKHIRRERSKVQLKRLHKKKLFLKRWYSNVKPLNYNQALLDKYLLALSNAINLSIHHNLAPIRCSLLVICSLSTGYELSKPRRSNRMKSLMNLLNFILGAMCYSLCEEPIIYVVVNKKYDVTPIEDMLLWFDKKTWSTPRREKETLLFRSLNLPLFSKAELLYKHREFDKIVVFGDCHEDIAQFVLYHRTNIGPIKAIWNNVSENDKWCSSLPMTGWIESKGLANGVFEYLTFSEEKNLVEQIDRIDETYGMNISLNLPRQPATLGDLKRQPKCLQVKSHGTFCRLYISSSYEDMRTERDLIYGVLVPTLRCKISSPLKICLDHVDLRLGAVDEAFICNAKALEICLKQTAACDIFVLLLGNRCSWVPNETMIKALPHSLLTEVKKFYKPGMSVTEMEYHMAKLTAPYKIIKHNKEDNSKPDYEMFLSRILVFTRNLNLRCIPNEYQHIFHDYDPTNLQNLNTFKQLILKDGVTSHSYPAEFIRVNANCPTIGKLEDFSNQFLSTLESSLLKLHKQTVVTDDVEVMDPFRLAFFETYMSSVASCLCPRHLLNIQHAFKNLTGQVVQSHLVCKSMKSAESSGDSHRTMETLDTRTSHKDSTNDGILIITGCRGSGKTTHLTALAMLLARIDRQSADMKSKTLSKISSCSQKSNLDRKSLGEYQILLHFCNGLPNQNLPACQQLSILLDNWIISITDQLHSIFSSSPIHKAFVSKINMHLRCFRKAGDYHNLKLKMLCFKKLITFLNSTSDLKYVFLIDDIDYLDPLILDWLPVQLPKNLYFIVTCDSNSKIVEMLTSRYNCSLFRIQELTVEECHAVAVNHMRQSDELSFIDSQLQNQIASLIARNESNNLLYSDIAFKYLELCRTEDEVKHHLGMFPATIDQLVEQIIRQVELKCGRSLTFAAFGFLIFCRRPLSTKDLYLLLNEWLSTPQRVEECGATLENDPLKMLSAVRDKPMNVDRAIIFERNIKMFIVLRNSDTIFGVEKPHQLYLPSLMFHLLLDELRPLLSFAKNTSSFSLSGDMALIQKISAWNLGTENLSFISQSVQELVTDVCFKTLINSSDTLNSDLQEYVEPHAVGKMCSSLNDAFSTAIHRILAIMLPDLNEKLHHFLYADELDVICHLLTSPVFITEVMQQSPSTVIEWLSGRCPTSDLCAQRKWKTKLESCPFYDKIEMMQRFIQTNYDFLVKYPTSFGELAINQNSNDWIHTLGLTLLSLTDVLQSNSSINNNKTHMFYRINSLDRALINPAKPNMLYKPISTLNGFMDVPTCVEINLTSNLLVYGTRCGTIIFTDASTKHEICSFTGHHSSVQSLCFLQHPSSQFESIELSQMSTLQLWLVSASEDGSVFIWDVSHFSHSIESKVCTVTSLQVADLCGYHRRCVTTSAWHPGRQIIATGDLDCMVYLWDIGQLGFGSSSISIQRDSVKLHPFKSLDIFIYPISSIAFRLPDITNDDQVDVKRSRDVLAVGCWDGMVHFYSLHYLSVVKSLSVSSSSISSLAYSPNGGNILATMNRDGQLMLWNDDILWYQAGLLQEYTLNLDEYFPKYNESPALIPTQSGKICFSKPHGRFIFQTGGGQFLDNYINIWDTGLWAEFVPWIDIKPCESNNTKNPAFVTCSTILLSHYHLILGWSNGDLTVVHIYDGQIVYRLNSPEEDNSSVQCIASNSVVLQSEYSGYLIIAGYSSGAVRIYVCTLKPKIKPNQNHYVYISPSAVSEIHFTLIETLLSHSTTDRNINCITETHLTGTLCVAADFCVAVSGGENSQVWLHFIGRRTGSKIVKSVCLTEHNAPVTAISLETKHFATVSQNRQLAVFKYDQRERTVALMHLISDACKSPITCLSLSRVFIGIKTISVSVYISDNDNLLHNYTIKDDAYQLKQTLIANKSPITSMDLATRQLIAASDDGEVSVWKFGKYGALTLSYRLNVQVDLEPVNSVLSEKVVKLVNIEIFSDFDRSWEFGTKLYPASSEVLDKPESQGEDGDDTALDPDAEITTPSEADATPSTYVTGSEQEIFECGYTLTTSIGEMDEIHNLDNDKCFHVLNSSRKGDLVWRDNSSNAITRLLYGINVSSSNEVQDFRYRIFAPFMLQYRGSLSGHSGLIPCALTSECSSNNDEDCVLVTAAGQTVNDVGCDIKLWSIPLKNQCLNCQPNEHSGRITCLSQLRITPDYSICISGCIDGSLMFWSIKKSNTEMISPAVFLHNVPFQCKPLAHLFCSAIRPKYPISDIMTQIYAENELNQSIVHYFIFIAYGTKLWRMHIVLNHLNQSTESIENTFEQLLSTKGRNGLPLIELDVFWSSTTDTTTIIRCEIGSFTASHPIARICSCDNKPNKLEQCQVVAALVNGDVIIVTSNERESFTFDQSVVQNGLMCSSINNCSSGILAAHSGIALLCKYFDESRMFKPFPGYIGSCEKEVWIHSVSQLENSSLLDGNNTFYLAECKMEYSWKIIVFNTSGDLVSDFTLQNSSVTVTAYCAISMPTKDNCSNMYLVLATSDNILRLLQCRLNSSTQTVSNQWKQVAVYSTKAQVDKILIVNTNPLIILCGDRQGQIDCYAVL